MNGFWRLSAFLYLAVPFRIKIMNLKTVLFAVIICIASVTNAKAAVIDTGRTFYKGLDTLKIVYLGSSVPYGTGATNNYGYTAMFTQLLKQRAAAGTGKEWLTVNKSIGGDNTVKVLNRWKRDLVPQKARYVIYALSLGNEGIHEFGKPKLDQFETNMTNLIAMARDSGYVPIVANCYTRGDFTETDYGYVKDLNRWINALDVPSINLLGAVDDGTGKWATNYWFNVAHPNDAGHREMLYAIVPSLFDALANGKPQPKWVDASGQTWGKSNTTLLTFKPDNITHSFTTTITIKAADASHILQITDSSSTGNIVITKAGVLEYRSARNQTITGITKINDGQWHKITLTQYTARAETDLYCDNILQGRVSERLSPVALLLGDKTGKNFIAKNWLFYRSGMNAGEIEALSKNTLLKSSLELYAPLDEKHLILNNVLTNLAQSTVVVTWAK
jgi:lysophospholipase L1-like esterase